MPPAGTTYTVTFLAATDGTSVVTVDEHRLALGVPVPGLTADAVRRLKQLRGLEFEVVPVAPAAAGTPRRRQRRTSPAGQASGRKRTPTRHPEAS